MPNPEKILLICPRKTNRLEYTLQYLSDRLGIAFEFLPENAFRTETENTARGIICYSQTPMAGFFNIYDSGLLFETGIKKQEPEVFRLQSQTFLLPAPGGFDLPSDILSAIFLLLSRYEEYLPCKPDLYGRFEADQSLAFQNGFLEEPVIDQWVEVLKYNLKSKFPALEFADHKFSYVSTFDVDSPWAFLHKGLIRESGGLLKTLLKGKITEFMLRMRVFAGKMTDPFDTYNYIRESEERHGFKSIFFFLAGNYGGSDTNYALKTIFFKDLVRGLSTDRSIGIHPSFKSYFNAELLKSEFDYFSGILGHKPVISRQHFLMMNFPDTYRRLISLGIQKDYSMGYASSIGFRAGTGNPFCFYDLKNECETSLVIFPFAVMDVTLLQYMSLSADEALERITHMIEMMKKVDGTFTSLWHNESLSDDGVWKGWRKVFEGMAEEAGSKEQEA